VHYLRALVENGRIGFPFEIEKAESPDFVVTHNGDRTIGIEHADAGSTETHFAYCQLEKAPPGSLLETSWLATGNFAKAVKSPKEPLDAPGFAGKEMEQEWAKLMHGAWEDKTEKLNKLHFTKYQENVLLLYDNTHVAEVGGTELSLHHFMALAKNSSVRNKYPLQFDRIALISRAGVHLNILC
jgi:hypothetical protein